MALIVETGNGASNSDSYASVADTSDYHFNRGNLAWAALASDTVREQCLRKATDYLSEVYRLRWAGNRKTVTQALDWPRNFVTLKDFDYNVIDSYAYIGGYYYVANDIVPSEVKRACMELALRVASGQKLSPDIQPLGNVIQETVVGAVSVTYSDKPMANFVSYRQVDNMLAVYLKNAGTGISINRG